MQRVTDYVAANVALDLTLADLAAVAGVSPSHLTVLFKRATGLSVHQYMLPDVAYLSYKRSASLSPAGREIPPIAPGVIVEILSPGNRAADVEAKRIDYLSTGHYGGRR